MGNLLSIIIPAWNEENTLEKLVSKVRKIRLPDGIEKEIIIIDDCSTDRTLEIIKNLGEKHKEIKGLSNLKNSGKSQTVKKGILASSGDYVVIQDADLEYEPEEIPEMLKLLIDKEYDAVYGNRFGKKNKVIYWQNYFGNKMLTVFSNIFTFPKLKTWIPDMEVCYKLVRGDVMRQIAKMIVSTSRFGLEPEITARLASYKSRGKRIKLGIHPISYYPRSIQEGKKMNALKHGFEALVEIIKFNLLKN
ncbi:glycosyltransferase family 2 protein [Candidatus Dojkabacteria bacterium]|nr:glycosyltransferase family 2 protein [Candidatus Dojkabacteria bacterium]